MTPKDTESEGEGLQNKRWVNDVAEREDPQTDHHLQDKTGEDISNSWLQ